MIYCKATTIGLDTKVKLIQRYLDSNLDFNDVHIYGLCQDTNRNGQIIPEYFDRGEYRDLFTDDTKELTVFFRELDRQEETATVQIIFALKIIQTQERDQEQNISYVNKMLKRSGYVVTISNMRQGIQDVFSGYNQDKIANLGMHPYFVFSFDLEVKYSYDR